MSWLWIQPRVDTQVLQPWTSRRVVSQARLHQVHSLLRQRERDDRTGKENGREQQDQKVPGPFIRFSSLLTPVYYVAVRRSSLPRLKILDDTSQWTTRSILAISPVASIFSCVLLSCFLSLKRELLASSCWIRLPHGEGCSNGGVRRT